MDTGTWPAEVAASAAQLWSPPASVVQAGVLFTSILFVLSNLLVDLSYGLVDPRIRDVR